MSFRKINDLKSFQKFVKGYDNLVDEIKYAVEEGGIVKQFQQQQELRYAKPLQDIEKLSKQNLAIAAEIANKEDVEIPEAKDVEKKTADEIIKEVKGERPEEIKEPKVDDDEDDEYEQYKQKIKS